jgi:hypothetical protein
MWAAVRGMQEASTRCLVVSGIMAGLAAATKYNAGLCLVMPLAVAALLPGVSLGRRVVLALWIGSSALLTFAAAMPWIWLAPRRVIASLSGVGAFYQRGQAGAESPSNWGFYGVYLWESGLTAGLAAAAILGWGALARSRPRAWLVATAFLVLYAALVASLRGRFVRNLMPLTGPIAVLSGIGFSCALAWLDRRPRGWRMAGRVAIGLAFAFAGLRVALYDYYLTETDTRVVARAWLEREEPGVSMCFAERALAPIPFAVPHLDLAGKECDLVIVSSHMYGPFLEDPEVDPAATAHYRDLFSRWNLEAEFTYTSSPVVRWLLGSDLPMHSPVVRVYRVSQGAPGG